ncbi:MAG: RICIN domain-containing protein [Coriobacteriales bacterium]|nr:RICIN domain-containing protein [Coriobacteriales bacterium]
MPKNVVSIMLVIIMTVALLPLSAITTAAMPATVAHAAPGGYKYSGNRFYYEALASQPFGSQLQAFYNMLVKEAEAIHTDLTTDYPQTPGESYSIYKVIDISSLQIPNDMFTFIDSKNRTASDMLDVAGNAFFHDNQQYLFLQPFLYFNGQFPNNQKAPYYQTATLFFDNDRDAQAYDYRLAADRRAHMAMVDATFAKYQALTASAASKYEKARLVHDQIVADWDYSGGNGSPYQGKMIGAMGLSDNGIVCRGYATLYAFVLNNLGVPTVFVGGEMVSGGNPIGGHAWNLVLMDDGKYYYADLTWADNQKTDYTGDPGNFKNPVSYEWFLLGGGNSGKFSQSHSPDITFLQSPYISPANIATDEQYNYKKIHSNYKFLLDVPGERFKGYDLGTYKMPATGNPNIRPQYFDTNMVMGVDYDIRFESPLVLGKNRVWFIGKGNYRGMDFGYITLVDNTSSIQFTVDLPKDKYEFTGNQIKPEPIVRNGNSLLIKGQDYTVTYENNIAKGTNAKVKIIGAGYYLGLASEKNFEIFSRSFTNNLTAAQFQAIYPSTKNALVLVLEDLNRGYGKPANLNANVLKHAQAAAVKYGLDLYVIDYSSDLDTYGFYRDLMSRFTANRSFGGRPILGLYKSLSDFEAYADTMNWSGNPYPLTYEDQVDEIVKNFFGTAGGGASTKIDISSATIKLSFTTAAYTGSEIKPAVTVTYQSKTLVENQDYILQYFDNINPGVDTASVSVIGKGSYTSSKAATFTITTAIAPPTKTPAKSDLVFSIPTGHVYNSSAQGIGAVTVKTGISGIGAITVKYNGSATLPINAGSYAVTVDIAAGSSYAAANGIALGTYSIAKANAVAPTSLRATYGSSLNNVALPSGWTWVSPSDSVGDAGTRTHRANFAGDTNYHAITSVLLTVTVAKAMPSLPLVMATTYGKTLSTISLPLGWTWDSPMTLVGNVGPQTHKASYAGTANYQSRSAVSLNINVYKALQSAPSAPVVASKTQVSVTLVAVSGAEYRCGDSGAWQTSPVFKSLTANTQYTFYQRLRADSNHLPSPASAGTIVRTDGTASKPIPTKDNLAFNIPTGRVYNGSAQGIGAVSARAGLAGMGAITVLYNGSTVLPCDAKSYTVTVNIAPGTNFASVNGLTLGTYIIAKATPAVPSGLPSATYGDLLSSVSLPIGWSWDNPLAPVGNAGIRSHKANYKAISSNYLNRAGVSVSIVVGKAKQSALPAPRIATRTRTTITLDAALGAEYRCDNGAWQKSNVFSGLRTDTQYTFYQRLAGTINFYESPISPGTQAKTASFSGTVVTFSTLQLGGRNIDIPARSTEQGKQAIIWDDNLSGNQRFRLKGVGNGYYNIINVNSGLALDISGARIANGAEVIQWPLNGSDNQKWSLVATADGAYMIASALNSNYVLDINGGGEFSGSKLIIWKRHGGTNQKWAIDVVSSTVSDGAYVITTAVSGGRAMDIEANSKDGGAKMLLWDRHNMANQQFTLKYMESTGYYVMTNVGSGQSVDVNGGSTQDGAQVIQWPLHGKLNQQWAIVPTGQHIGDKPTYFVIAANSGLALDVEGGNAANNGNIIQWPLHGKLNQQWILTDVSAIRAY